VSLGRAVVGKHGYLAVVGSTQRAGVLALDADRLGSLLGETRLVGVPNGVIVAEDFDDEAAQLGENLAIRPDAGGDEGLQRSHGPTAHRFRNVLGVSSFTAAEESLNEAACMSLIPL
jgi:hypothetical protein